MSDPIDINEERNKREAPDAAHCRRDEFGAPLYEFMVQYNHDGGVWSFTIWAYSMEDAQAKVDSINKGVVFRGQVFSTIPG